MEVEGSGVAGRDDDSTGSGEEGVGMKENTEMTKQERFWGRTSYHRMNLCLHETVRR